MVSNTMQASCELEDKPEIKAIVGRINKGDRIICTGKLKGTFLVLLGLTTVLVDGIAVTRN